MFRKTATAAVAAALVAGAALTTGSAPAEAKKWYNTPGAAAAGGFVAGALVGSALSQPRYYYEPAPVYVEPAPVYYDRPAPWTPAWYQYCSARFRTFNPETGYYFYRSGKARFCR